ncbi:MAG: hypothetical protein C4525_10320 [Desulfarculus sp.]|jgi:serine phosphatase RsbU (regulator of sigma subunit)|nr:MAG: hypothetical protein C4525_10320 [Desulfarculus sp.]
MNMSLPNDSKTDRIWLGYGLWGLVAFAGLYLASLYSYLLFHSLAEIFSVVVACAVFVVAWNTRGIQQNPYLLFLGMAYLFVGALDFLHMLAYKGMGVFPDRGSNLPTQLWIAARYMQALCLLAAPAMLGRRVNAYAWLAVFSAILTLLLVSIFPLRLFPVCYLEGVGLTPFKKISEYIICLILGGALAYTFSRRADFDPQILWLILWAIILTVGGEILFTLYITVYGLPNLLGHFFKIISFYLIYKAIVETSLQRPYRLLFRDLQQINQQMTGEIAQRRRAEGEKNRLIRDLQAALGQVNKLNDILNADLQTASRYQHHLLPSRRSLDGVKFDYVFQPCAGVGGDYFDFFRLPDGGIAFLVVDVSGHGVSAAMTATMLKALLPLYLRDTGEPAPALAALNRDLHRLITADAFVSCFAAVYHRSSGRLAWASAGHPPALLLHGQEPPRRLQQESMFLGAFSDQDPVSGYQQEELSVAPGDRLALYTDGLIEARDSRENQFGLDRLAQELTSLRNQPIGQACQSIQQSVVRFSGGQLTDDLVFMLVEF